MVQTVRLVRTTRSKDTTEASSLAIDRASSEPYYLQLGRLLTDHIDKGQYVAGDRLPSEVELCRTYDLSRSTVRESLRLLETNGKIRLVQRRGAFVCRDEHPGWMVQFAGGFSESEAAHENRDICTKVLGVLFDPLPDEACEALGLAPRSEGIMLERLRWVDGQLALFARNYLLPELRTVIGDASQLDGRASLNRLIRKAGWAEGGARRSLSAAAATPTLAAHLKVEVGSPLLLVRSVTWDAREKAYDYYTSWLNSDVIDVSIQVQVATGGRG